MSSEHTVSDVIDVEIYLLFVNEIDLFGVLTALQGLTQKHMNYRYIKENPVLPGCIIIETSIAERFVTRLIAKHLQRIGYGLSFEIYKPLYT